MPACPHPRHDCSGKLAARYEPDRKCAKAKTLMDMKRQHRYRQSDDNECNKDRYHDRQQRRAGAALISRIAELGFSLRF
jgi:hypothetical protein